MLFKSPKITSEYIVIEKYNNRNFAENNYEYIDSKYGIKALLSLQGDIHNDTYISNRLFETVGRAHVAITCSPLVKSHFENAVYAGSVPEVMDKLTALMQSKMMWCKTISDQIDEVIEKFNGKISVHRLFRHIKQICWTNGVIIDFDQ